VFANFGIGTLAGTSDVTVSVIVSMALETGNVKKSPKARPAARVVASALGITALAMRATMPTPVAAIKFKIDGNEMHRAFSPMRLARDAMPARHFFLESSTTTEGNTAA
jgi:hypothetical protein